MFTVALTIVVVINVASSVVEDAMICLDVARVFESHGEVGLRRNSEILENNC
jgi:hypothetical protein